MRTLVLLALTSFVLSGAACGSKVNTLGKTPKAPLSTILAINAGDAPASLSLEGIMIEKCPQAGCWFRIEDGTGVIKVDTKAAGFVVTDVPLNTKMKVGGKLKTVGGESQLEASGLTY